MNYIHKQRLILIILIVGCVAAAAGLALYALQQNINLFFSPTQLANGAAPRNHEIRLGGLVKAGSVKHTPNSLKVRFVVTDNKSDILVEYNDVLPDLFREGQSVVVEGQFFTGNIFVADQVLAKHDEKYMPAAVKNILQKGKS